MRALFITALAVSTVMFQPTGASKPRPESVTKHHIVHGFLDAHWEYPNFLPDDLPTYQALPFEFRDEKWLDAYSEPLGDAYKYRPDETVCFRISGEGYVAPRRPTTMWPANEQFIFTKVIEMKQMPNEAECAKRMKRSGN